jgi:hypothetical protein
MFSTFVYNKLKQKFIINPKCLCHQPIQKDLTFIIWNKVKSIFKTSTDTVHISISTQTNKESKIKVFINYYDFYIGKFYICSKSLVYESDNKNLSLVKFRFDNLKSLPTFSISYLNITIIRQRQFQIRHKPNHHHKIHPQHPTITLQNLLRPQLKNMYLLITNTFFL